MYSPVLSWVDVDVQPIADSIEAAMKTAKNRFSEVMFDLRKALYDGRLPAATQ
jgi:hypothetical protein